MGSGGLGACDWLGSGYEGPGLAKLYSASPGINRNLWHCPSPAPQEFLKKEFSAENVYFWQACERFQQISAKNTQQLAQEARRIYDEFLSSHALSPVNIDRQAWIGEEMLATPTPDMLRLQQLQSERYYSILEVSDFYYKTEEPPVCWIY
nr:regulator of G-protein signaling 14-like [Pelodiscus sinensis]|eukprot:XP_025039694.1 regulator of G-protein signaling 14-like [Pelodiscus sinensis]